MKESTETTLWKAANYVGITLYPNLIITFYSLESIRKTFSEFLIKNNLEVYKGLMSILVIISLFLVPIFVVNFLTKWDLRKYEIRKKVLTEVLSGVQNVLNEKKKRFNLSSKNTDHTITEATIFREITKPRDQIEEIFKNTVDVFKSLCDDKKIKGSLIECKNNVMNDYFITTDTNQGITIEEMNKNDSTAKWAIKHFDIGLIENTDIPYDVWYFMKNRKCKSILCAPVIDGSEINFVLCLTSKSQYCFKRKNIDIYQYVLEEFFHRINLEYYLLSMKRRYCNED